MAHDPMGGENDGADCPEENPFSPNASQPKQSEYRPSDYIFMAYGGVILRDVLLWDEVDGDVDPACAW